MTQTPINDLWGTIPGIAEMGEKRTPYTILLEQAKLLEEKTNGLLTGEVERYSIPSKPSNDSSDSQLLGMLKLLIVAPALDDYSYVAVSLTYPVATLYPVTMEIEDKPITCHSEEELLPVLEEILSSKKTRQVITNLLAQIWEEARATEERERLAEERRRETEEQMIMRKSEKMAA